LFELDVLLTSSLESQETPEVLTPGNTLGEASSCQKRPIIISKDMLMPHQFSNGFGKEETLENINSLPVAS